MAGRLAVMANADVLPARGARRAPAHGKGISAQSLRRWLYQAALLTVLVLLAALAWRNVLDNLAVRGVQLGFDFLGREAGFGIGFSVIPYAEHDTYLRVFLVGVTNTALAAGLGIAFATVLGLVIGIARLSPNWAVSRAALVYIEAVRNLPLLLHVLIWYNLVLRALPPPRGAYSLFEIVFVSNRGIYLPWPRIADGAIVLEIPRLQGFNFVGGGALVPELAALVAALAIYNASFIAELVRCSIEAVGRGQREAATALGLTRGLTLRLVVIPQALRVLIPPLCNQYLHLLKASSLAIVIGFPDLVNVFVGTAVNQTGRAVEIVLMTMAVFLAIGGLISLACALFARATRIVER